MSTNEERAVENRRSEVQEHAVQATEARMTRAKERKRGTEKVLRAW